MKDEQKTKKQLINELVEMRKRVTEFETEQTEGEQAEEALQQSEIRYRLLAENVTDIIWTTDMNLRFTYVSPSVTRMLGYSVDEVIAQSAEKILAPASLDVATNTFAEEIAIENMEQKDVSRLRTLELELIRKDGSIVWTETKMTFLRDTDGGAVGILGVTRDITERKRAEETLSRQALIFENVHDGIIVTDLESHIIDWNRAAERIFGYSKEEVLGKTTGGITTDVVTATLRDGRWCGEINFMRKDGTEGVCETIIVPLHDGQGNTTATVGVNRDITDRKQAEGALKQSYQKLQRTFEETINVLASAVEMRDPYTAGHQYRVTKLACAIAREIDFPEEQSQGLRLAATIHDIGKIYVPAEILSKPSQLGQVEYDLIRSHPQVGYEILNGIEFPWPVGQIVLQHHERLDGSGYPHGIAGDAIIREARILAVADVVEAMASHRPYRAARGTGDALEEILHNKGILYDPEVVDACLRVFYDKAFKFD